MNTHKHKMRWGIVLAAGIIVIAIGVLVIYYAIAVVAKGRFPDNFYVWMIDGCFSIGVGLGIVLCVPVIRSLEMKLSPIDYGKEEKIYPKGYSYYAYKDILDIIKEAKNEVIITDNYADEELINLYLEKIPEKVKIRVLTKNPQGNFIVVAKKFKTKPNVDFEVRKSMEWHDRWVFVDNECWVTGQSVKDAGVKPTYLVELKAYDLLKRAFDEIWDRASPIV